MRAIIFIMAIFLSFVIVPCADARDPYAILISKFDDDDIIPVDDVMTFNPVAGEYTVRHKEGLGVYSFREYRVHFLLGHGTMIPSEHGMGLTYPVSDGRIYGIVWMTQEDGIIGWTPEELESCDNN